MIGVALLLGTQMLIGESFLLGDEELIPSSPVDAALLFQRVCVTPFPDRDAFNIAAAADSEKLTFVKPSEVGEMRRDGKIARSRGVMWHAKRFNVRYFASGDVMASLPAPQCKVTVRLDGVPDHAKLATTIADTLKLTDAHQLTINQFTRTYWDIAQSAGPAWRVMLKSETGSKGNFMSLGLVKLKN